MLAFEAELEVLSSWLWVKKWDKSGKGMKVLLSQDHENILVISILLRGWECKDGELNKTQSSRIYENDIKTKKTGAGNQARTQAQDQSTQKIHQENSNALLTAWQ
jgi:hypothetical protein